MSVNPPILSVSAQEASPDEQIHRFLASITPYAREHAQIGQQSFEQEVKGRAVRRDEELVRPRSSSQAIGPDWMPTRAELQARLERREGGHRHGAEGNGADHPTLGLTGLEAVSERSDHVKRDRRSIGEQHPRRKHASPTGQQHRSSKSNHDERPTGRNTGRMDLGSEAAAVSEEASSESSPALFPIIPLTRRTGRLQRKQRRREKAAILKPKPSTPSPPPAAPTQRTSRKRPAPPPSESQSDERDLRFKVPSGRKGAYKTGPGMELLKSFHPTNIHTGKRRLTVRWAIYYSQLEVC